MSRCENEWFRNPMKRQSPTSGRLTTLNLASLALAFLSIVSAQAGSAKGASANEPVDFSSQIRPIISGKCFSCHGADESSRKAKLRLDLRDEAIKDRKGIRAIVPGDLANSEMVRRITATDPDDVMPPPKTGHKLTEGEIELLKHWIQ